MIHLAEMGRSPSRLRVNKAAPLLSCLEFAEGGGDGKARRTNRGENPAEDAHD